jgi:hypothetical protein
MFPDRLTISVFKPLQPHREFESPKQASFSAGVDVVAVDYKANEHFDEFGCSRRTTGVGRFLPVVAFCTRRAWPSLAWPGSSAGRATLAPGDESSMAR